jgi:hypothetical protein
MVFGYLCEWLMVIMLYQGVIWQVFHVPCHPWTAPNRCGSMSGFRNQPVSVSYLQVMAPSSSGPGRLVLIQKIAGSTPAGVTIRDFSIFASAVKKIPKN